MKCYQIRAGESTSEAVIRAVADVMDRDPLDLEPFADTIDPEAVDNMFTRSSGEDVATLEMIYEGCLLRVESDDVYVKEILER